MLGFVFGSPINPTPIILLHHKGISIAQLSCSVSVTFCKLVIILEMFYDVTNYLN